MPAWPMLKCLRLSLPRTSDKSWAEHNTCRHCRHFETTLLGRGAGPCAELGDDDGPSAELSPSSQLRRCAANATSCPVPVLRPSKHCTSRLGLRPIAALLTSSAKGSNFTFHYLSLHFIAFHCIAFHCISLHFIAFHCIAFHCISLHFIALHYITLRYISLHFIAFHCISLHFITFQCIS